MKVSGSWNKLLMFTLVSLVAAAVQILPVGAEDGAAPEQEGAESASRQMDVLLSRLFRDDEPGAAIIVCVDGRTIFRRAYGLASMELNVRMAPEMVFKIASVTKQFTAVAVMRLVEEGRLSL